MPVGDAVEIEEGQGLRRVVGRLATSARVRLAQVARSRMLAGPREMKYRRASSASASGRDLLSLPGTRSSSRA